MGIVTADIALSLDGYAAGPNQSLDKPMGEGVEGRLHTWMFAEYADRHAEEIDAITAAGAYVMGRKMFGPVRDEWPAPGAPTGHRHFAFDLDGLPPGVSPKGSFDLTFTVVEGGRAMEVTTHLD